METEKSKLNAVWNADNGMWVVLKNDPDEMVTAPTIMELHKILEDLPLQIRYPGNTELIDRIH